LTVNGHLHLITRYKGLGHFVLVDLI